MKKYILSILVAAMALVAQAQDVENSYPVATVQPTAATVGYFSYKDVLESMPEYAIAGRQLSDLRAKYDAEMQRVKDEFNAKYEEFLEGQKDFPPTILKKRQTELEELMNKNIAFKEESRRLLAEAERTIYAPLHEKISAALAHVGAELDLTIIVNTDSDACPYFNPSRSVNVTMRLKNLLAGLQVN